MIRDLDETLRNLLRDEAPVGSALRAAEISFDIPDADWRSNLSAFTVNCYLYDLRENLDLKRVEPIVQRSPDRSRASRRLQPVRLDCTYCITAWSTQTQDAVLEEHRVLSQIFSVLIRNPIIPTQHLVGQMQNQIPPYPTLVAQPDGVRNQPEFWGALDQQLKPSLSYVITLAVPRDDAPDPLGPVVGTEEDSVRIGLGQRVPTTPEPTSPEQEVQWTEVLEDE